MRKYTERHAETGYVLLTTVLLLALVTVVAFSAMRTSAVEIQIAANELIYQKNFFLAEAGLAHAVSILVPRFLQENDPGTRAAAPPSWDFAFRGPDRIGGTADDARGNGRQPGSYARGARWLDVRQPDGSRYTVTLWNNDEPATDGDYDTDRDGLIWLRSDAYGLRGGRASVQLLLQGAATTANPAGYPAQAGGGAANNNSGPDRDPIIDFDVQLAPIADP